MAHTYRDLWPQFVSWDNLLLAYRKCRKRKRFKRGAVEFDYAWESNLLWLQADLRDGSYRPGKYRHFYINDPKRRKISAAPFRDRIVHHAIVNVLEPIFERRFIYDSYACRKGKGTHRALDRAQQFLRRYPYYLKTDIVRFFPNVDHAVMLDGIGSVIHDKQLLDLITQIIASGEGVLADEATEQWFPDDDLFAQLRPKGLPIGNLTSQFFANVLLDKVDHFIKEELRVKGYVRYADDLLLFGNSKSELRERLAKLERFFAGLRLTLHRHKTHVAPCATGVRYLGFHLFRDGRRLTRESIRRFQRRLRRFQAAWREMEMPTTKIRLSLRAWLAHTSLANSTGIRRTRIHRYRFQRSGKMKTAETGQDRSLL